MTTDSELREQLKPEFLIEKALTIPMGTHVEVSLYHGKVHFSSPLSHGSESIEQGNIIGVIDSMGLDEFLIASENTDLHDDYVRKHLHQFLDEGDYSDWYAADIENMVKRAKEKGFLKESE